MSKKEKFELNKESKQLLRQEVDAALDNYGTNNQAEDIERIKLTKKELDELLFDTCVDNNGVKYKKFAFFSKNLRKLDLSRISLNNVSLANLSSRLHLNYTNIKIDFTKTYEYKNNKKVYVSNIDFSLLDLSSIDFTKFSKYGISFSDCNFYKTSLVLDDTCKNISFKNCGLCYNSFDKLSIIYNKRGSSDITGVSMKNCSLTNTGINIKINFPMDETEKTTFVNEFNHGYYSECYINGRYMNNPSAILARKDILSKEYEDFFVGKTSKICKKILDKCNTTKNTQGE